MSAREPLVFAALHLPRPLTPDATEQFLVRLAADPTSAPVVLEARAVAGQSTTEIRYWIGTPPKHTKWLVRTLHDLLPGVIVGGEDVRPDVQAATRVKVRPIALALTIDQPEPVTRAILSALNARLQPGEQLVLQLVLGPRRTPRHLNGTLADPTQPWWSLLASGTRDAPTAVAKQHQVRYAQAGFATCIRLGVTATTPDRGRRLLTGLLGALSTAKAPGTFIRLTRDRAVALNQARPPLIWEFAPAAVELVGLLAWPLGENELPGVAPLHPKLLPPPPALSRLKEPTRTFGASSVPGQRTPIGISAADSLFHLVTTGPTGSGKSTAMLHLIGADIAAGRPVVVIDPKYQLVDDVIERAVPATQIDRVVVLDPSEERVPGFNPLDVADRDPDVVVDGLLSVFAAVFHDGWGPRTQDIFHSGLLTLARVGAARQRRGESPFTLLDLPRLFTDAGFRRQVIGGVSHDPGLATFWAWYNAQSPKSQAAVLAAPLNKLRQYLLRPSVRRIIGQAEPTFRLRDVFRDNKIVLVPLNDGLVGPITAQLIGSLIVAELWSATLERAAEHQPTKRPASIWIDETQTFLHLPTSIDSALNASRSMGVSWNLAHQFRAQMPPSMLAAIDSNARNKLVFAPQDPKDAAAYAKQARDLTAEDFMALGQYEVYATVVADGASQQWCSVRTLPPPDRTGLGSRIRTASRDQYARTVTEDPEPLRPEDDGPVGRIRRPK